MRWFELLVSQLCNISSPQKVFRCERWRSREVRHSKDLTKAKEIAEEVTLVAVVKIEKKMVKRLPRVR
jgi:hypothetical protein